MTILKPLSMRFFSLLFATLLVACASQPPAPTPSTSNALPPIAIEHQAQLHDIQSFDLAARLSVNTQQQGFSGSINWQHLADQDLIRVISPFGGKVAQIEKTPTFVKVTDDKGHSTSATDVEILTEKTLGFRLPLQGLEDWAIGRPTEAPIEFNSWDTNGRLLKLKQNGWEIDYVAYEQQNGLDLPKKIHIRNEQVFLKLLVEQWKNIE